MNQKNSRNRHVWTFNETKAFLAAYSARKAEFDHPRKKKFAMANVLEDLIGQNVLSEPTTVEDLQNKLKNLLRAYKAAKDGNSLTGNAPIIVPFAVELEEIFGNQPNISNDVTLNLRGRPIAPLEVTSITPCLTEATPSSSSSAEPILLPLPTSSSPVSPHSPSPSTSQPYLSPTTSTLTPSPKSAFPKRRNQKAEWYTEKIKHLKRKEEMLQTYMKQKEDRFKQFEEQRRIQHGEKMKLLKELINREESENNNNK